MYLMSATSDKQVNEELKNRIKDLVNKSKQKEFFQKIIDNKNYYSKKRRS